jgi:hypothetical protein
MNSFQSSLNSVFAADSQVCQTWCFPGMLIPMFNKEWLYGPKLNFNEHFKDSSKSIHTHTQVDRLKITGTNAGVWNASKKVSGPPQLKYVATLQKKKA